MEWTRAEFQSLHRGNVLKTVYGLVRRPFGVHRLQGGYYCIVHLPTGLGFPWGSKEIGKVTAAADAMIAGWQSAEDPHPDSDPELWDQTQRLLNRLVRPFELEWLEDVLRLDTRTSENCNLVNDYKEQS